MCLLTKLPTRGRIYSRNSPTSVSTRQTNRAAQDLEKFRPYRCVDIVRASKIVGNELESNFILYCLHPKGEPIMALKSIHVLIVEDDPYARDMMAMLLARDWRTRVVGELHAKQQVQEFFSHLEHRVDVVLMDTEFPGHELLPLQIAEMIDRLENSPVTVYMGTHVDAEKIAKLLPHHFAGFLLKDEILYALAAAVSLAAAGNIVLSPGAADATAGLDLQGKTQVLAGRSLEAEFPQRMSEILRLGLLFNLSQRDIADELVLSQNWVAEAISGAYQRLGMQEILTGEVGLEDYFQDKIVLERGKAILQRPASSKKSHRLRKAPWMATLAFHMLTRPKEEPFSSNP